MELHDPNAHLKLIEMCDCYLDTDYPAAIQKVADSPSDDIEEEAVRYLALAILFALTQKAQKLSLKRKKEKITVTIQGHDEKVALRHPSRPIFDKIIAVARAILHLDEDKGALPLALGLRSGQVELQVKIERKNDKESLKIKLPTLE